MSARYIPSLNGLRTISIAFVIIGHIGFRNFMKVDSPGGQLGVNIFFIISGFLITHLLLEEEKMNGKISLQKFYSRRTIRIFPVFYSLLLVYLILQLLGILHFTKNSWITSLTYTKYLPIPDSKEWETEHLWSLSVEEHFYLIWPFIFKYLKAYRVKIAIFIILLIPILRGINFQYTGENNPQSTLYFRADALMMGCLLAIYKKQVSDWTNRLIKWNRLAIFLPAVGFILSVFALKSLSQHIHSSYINSAIRALGRSTGTFTSIFECLGIVVSVDFTNNLWFKFLNTHIMNYIGKLSYSLYIWQQVFFSYHIGMLGKFPINIFCIMGSAIISYYLIEKPFLKFKSKFEVKKIVEQPEIQAGTA
jgi:peptidoglycan/LPS O-acetylase OafA/YrhL